MKWVYWLFAICLFTASCDIILTVDIAGIIRLCQIVMIFVCLAALARCLQDGRVLWPRGATALSLWLLFQVIFLPISGSLLFGLQSFIVVLYSALWILAVVQLYGNNDLIVDAMQLYMRSFVFVAAFGAIQFLGPLLFHLPGPLVAQWILHGRVARINGFNYEPSFFATYLIVGWIMLVDLRLTKARIVDSPFWKWSTVLVTLVLFLTTSKTAWIFMVVELIARVLPPVWRGLRNSVRLGRLFIRIPRGRIVIYSILFVVVATGAIGGIVRLVADPSIFLGGTGLAGNPAHSVVMRSDNMYETISAIEEAPFVGRTLGGIPIYLAGRKGIEIHNSDDFRGHQAFPVLLEVLLASGVFGFIPFLVFLWANTFGAMRFARRRFPDERAKWLQALARAMIFEWLALCVDHNLLRTYLWFQFAMIAAVSYHLEFAPAPVIPEYQPRRPLMIMLEEPTA